MKKHSILLMGLLLTGGPLWAQDNLLNMLNSDNSTVAYTTATFKSTRIINGHSVETTPGKHLDFWISHRFGTLNSGAYNLWGLDQAFIRLGFEYGLTDRWMVGLGRSSNQKMYDLFTKAKLLRQSSGRRNVPVTITVFGSAAVNTLRFQEDRTLQSRLAYTAQILIARKFTDRLSLQLTPTLLHRNRIENVGEANTIFAVGLGGRYKLTKRIAFNADYYYVLPDQLDVQLHNSLALGFDIETGGHVFSLHFTNSLGMVEKQFIGETIGQWGNGDIHYGFNISRTFSFDKRARQLNQSK